MRIDGEIAVDCLECGDTGLVSVYANDALKTACKVVRTDGSIEDVKVITGACPCDCRSGVRYCVSMEAAMKRRGITRQVARYDATKFLFADPRRTITGHRQAMLQWALERVTNEKDHEFAEWNENGTVG